MNRLGEHISKLDLGTTTIWITAQYIEIILEEPIVKNKGSKVLYITTKTTRRVIRAIDCKYLLRHYDNILQYSIGDKRTTASSFHGGVLLSVWSKGEYDPGVNVYMTVAQFKELISEWNLLIERSTE